MELEILFSTLMILLVLGGITILVNWAEQQPRARSLAVLSMFMFNGMVLLYKGLEVLSVSVMSEAEQIETFGNPIAAEQHLAGFAVIFIACGLGSLLLSEKFRQMIAPLFPRPRVMETAAASQPAPYLPFLTLQNGEITMQSGQSAVLMAAPVAVSAKPELIGFRPESLVHTWAAILVVQFAGLQFASFAESGGLSGVAENIGVTYMSLLSNFLPALLIPILGVGIFIRRNWRDSMRRLGVESMSFLQIIASGVTVFLLLFGLIIMVGIWASVVSQETIEEQTEASSALGDSITTIWLALMVAGTAAIGEELAFRGALQPVFGLWATAIIFTVVHIQYTLTPASLFIFLVAVTLGYIRRYFNTTTAMVVHFFYNLIPLLFALGAEEATEALIRNLL